MKINITLTRHDPDAKPDSYPTVTGNMPWANADDLRYDDRIPEKYMTGEWNYSVLDGSMEEFPDEPEGMPWGLWSESVSGSDSAFVTPPTLDITFGSPRKSGGLTFWQHSPAGDVHITWYDTAGSIIAAGTYDLRKSGGTVEEYVSDYSRVRVEFLSTGTPGRFLKMYKIDYGLSVEIPDHLIDKISILEEIDPIGDMLTVNTLSFSVRGGRQLFAPSSGSVVGSMLSRKQRAVVRGDGKLLAVSFLQGPPRDVYGNGLLYEFTARDAVGAMDGLQFHGGIYDKTPARELIAELFALCFPTGVVGFRLDPALEDATVSGWLPKCTCRVALQQICFALGAVADTSRREYVWIYPPDTEQSLIIPLTRILRSGGNITSTDYYSGVELVAHGYSRSDEDATGWRGELSPGDYGIGFTQPLHSLTVTGAEILDSGANHATLRVTQPGEVVVAGKRYDDTRVSFFASEPVETGEVESVAVFDGCTLVDANRARELSGKLLEYLKNRVTVEAKIVPEDAEVGYIALIETGAAAVLGTIERLELNPRSERAKIKITGKYMFERTFPVHPAGTFRAGQFAVPKGGVTLS